MELNNLNEFIIDSLKEYDNNCLMYNKYTNSKIKIKIDHNINEINFIDNDDNNIYKNNFEILGIFDNSNHIWIWGWAIYINNDLIKITKDLLNYGLKLEPRPGQDITFNSFIKSLLVNSRILIETDVELNNNIAIIYNLIKNKFSFIYPYKYYLDDNKFIIYYYMVK